MICSFSSSNGFWQGGTSLSGGAGQTDAEVIAAFSEQWIGHAQELGFVLKPQGPAWAPSREGAIIPVEVRVEYTSKVIVPYKSQNELYAAFTPKPLKTHTKFMVSFIPSEPMLTTFTSKAISAMDSCKDSAVLISYFAAPARVGEKEGGISTPVC